MEGSISGNKAHPTRTLDMFTNLLHVIQEKTIDPYFNSYGEEVNCGCGVKNAMDSYRQTKCNGIRKMKQ